MSIRADQMSFFQQVLLDFLKKSGRHELPWRKKNMTAYEVWVSEIMLQQTQVSRVIGYYTRFLKRFPTVQKLSAASWEEFLPYYEGLGYYARGRHMLRTAQVVSREWSGKFPKSVVDLEKLPGIGPYTARAIASFASGAPYLAWDTNLKRVMGRFFFGHKEGVGERAMELFDEKLGKDARKLNAALMDFGSALCTARPKCANCPLGEHCRYLREGGKQELRQSQRGAKPAEKAERVIIFLHERHRQYFSQSEKFYQPFWLPKGYLTRAAIKDYFAKQYGLTLAVRPPHKQVLFQRQPILLIHAQILLGHHSFSTFPKSAVLEYTKREKLV